MMGRLDKAASIDDLRRMARRRLPRFAFDFIDGGAESEIGLARNRSALDAVTLAPRYAVNVEEIDMGVDLFGRRYRRPFGIAPMGFINMSWPGADLAFARLAAREGIPHLVSSAASTSLERIGAAAEGNAWFQLYVSADDETTEHLVGRAEAAGYEVLVVTVDVTAAAKRDRDIRNGLKIPFRIDPATFLDLALHPRWSLSSLAAGAPRFGNFTGEMAQGYASLSLAEIQSRVLMASAFDWAALKRLRDRWKGRLVIKGLMRSDDAEQAMAAGCDGVIVSNHGGRQADYAPAAIEALPSIAAICAGKATVMLDSGVRRGADILRAKALGADCCFAGRAFAYGAGAGGDAGAARAFGILETELERALGQTGRPVYRDVGAETLSEQSAGLAGA